MQIHYFRHKDIDKIKWDKAIDTAVNGNIYAYSWYLDCVADNWDALATPDYSFVMPLPWNSKWLGYKQIYQPLFAQQYGVFGEEPITPEILRSFMAHIPKHFRYFSLNFNEKNPVLELDNVNIFAQPNMLLELSNTYEYTHKKFRKSLRNKLRRAEKHLHFETNKVSPELLVQTYKTHLNAKLGFPDSYYDKVLKLIKETLLRKKGTIYSVHFEDDSLASGIFVPESHGRLVQLFGPSTPEGKELSAKHLLTASIIEKYSATNKKIDFEGSSIPSIAEFFRGFSPTTVEYYRVEFNNFPFWIKVLQLIRKKFKG